MTIAERIAAIQQYINKRPHKLRSRRKPSPSHATGSRIDRQRIRES